MKEQNKKAQVAVMGLLFAFMLVATAAIIQQPLLEFVEIGINNTLNSSSAHASLMVTVMNILPVFMWLVVLIAVVALITGRTS